MTRALLLLVLTLSPASLWGAQPAPVAMPAATAADWKQDAVAALKASEKQAEATAVAGESLGTWRDWVLGGVLLVLGAGRFIPGVGGQIANILYSIMASRAAKEQEAKRDLMADGFSKVINVIQSLPNDGTVGALKEKINNKLPSEVVDAIRAQVNPAIYGDTP